ncbi:MAG: nucleotide exchange factor GrpE [Armatimonadota bacterium]|nr:nucleotide exchange factor GrpE [Armatimonadota bacterium]
MTDETIEENEEVVPEEITEIQVLEAQIADLEGQLIEAEAATLRAVADFQNYRRRSLQEAVHNRETATAALAMRLLPLLDNFERTLAASQTGADVDALVEGVRLMDRQLRAALEEFHVEPIEALGEHFDPHLHDAVLSEPSDQPEGTVMEVLEPGYRMGKRVLRPAKTRVSKGPE